MKLQLQVIYDKQTIVCTTSLKVLVDWERKYKKRAGDLAQGFAMEDLAYMAWASLKANGHTLPDFDTFLDKLEQVDVIGGEDSNPTDAAATADN